MNLSDIKVGDVLILGDEIDGDKVEGSPIYGGDKIDTKDNLNYDIYYEERGPDMDYIFQLKKEAYHHPLPTSPFNYICVDVEEENGGLKILLIENEEVVIEIGRGMGGYVTENLIIEGGDWREVGMEGMIPRWFAGEGLLCKIIPLNPFQYSFLNWSIRNPMEVKE